MTEDMIPEEVSHKIIFFFMPELIAFAKPKAKEDVDLVTLKSISPCFYWCSAHEFPDFEPRYKYLFQYQIYSIEGGKIIPGEVFQEWYRNKNQIRENIISFIEIWEIHKRLLMWPEGDGQDTNNFSNKIHLFSSFAEFVAKSILKMQKIYLEQSSLINFDILQKEFWKMIALNKMDSYNTLPGPKNKKQKPTNKKNKKNDRKKRNTVK